MSLDKNDAIRFLIQCYFGDEEDPTLMAIDRAYRDMVTHTLFGDAETILFPMRKKVTEILYEEIKKLSDEINYDSWHKNTSKRIKDQYPDLLTIGHIQKWINMTIKYLYTLKAVDVKGVSDYFANVEHVKEFHAPLDSYVLKKINETDPVWSKIDDYDDYMCRKKAVGFEEEYRQWPNWVKEINRNKMPDKNTYKRYLKDIGGYSHINSRNEV